jgi:hypothetical protein
MGEQQHFLFNHGKYVGCCDFIPQLIPPQKYERRAGKKYPMNGPVACISNSAIADTGDYEAAFEIKTWAEIEIDIKLGASWTKRVIEMFCLFGDITLPSNLEDLNEDGTFNDLF